MPADDQAQKQGEAVQRFFEDVKAGDLIPAMIKQPTQVQLFRFSAVTWNSHRIHYDSKYAATEGYPDVLVQAHLHGSFLQQAVSRWAGPRARLVRFRWANRQLAVPGDTLTCSGKVTRTYIEEGRCLVDCELEERNQRGELCAPGAATVALPSRAS